MGTGFFPG